MNGNAHRGRHGAPTADSAPWAPSRRTVLASATVASTLLIALAGSSVAASRAQTTLEVDGVSQPIVTWGGTVATVLAEAGVELGEHDLVQPALGAPAPDGGEVLVRTAKPYTVSIDGQEHRIWSTSSSADAVLADSAALGTAVTLAADRSASRGEALPLIVRDRRVRILADGAATTVEARRGDEVNALLERAGIAVGANDRVSLATGDDGVLTLSVSRVSRGIVTSDIPVPYEEQQVESAELFLGETRITQEGVAGIARRSEWVETRDGETAAQATASEQVTTPPSPAIRTIGTKPVTPEALVMAGLDPKATLQQGSDAMGRPYAAYTGALGTLSSAAEIEAIVNTLPDQASKVAAAAAAQRAGVRISYTGQDPKEIAQIQVAARGWSASEFQCLVNLWNRESRWNPYAENASSGAYGIPQSLPGSKMASAGADWRTNPATQITWGLGYIAGRYGTPCSAWAHSNAVGWY